MNPGGAGEGDADVAAAPPGDRPPTLLLVNYEFPPLGGGAANATANLAREFAALGCVVTVLTAGFRGLPRHEELHGYRIRRVPARRRRADRSSPAEMLTFLGSAAMATIPLARRLGPDATIAFFGIPSGPVGLLLKRALGIPYIVSLRGGDVPGFQPYDLALYHRIAAPFIRRIWRGAAAVVANSEGLRQLAVAAAPGQEVRVIPNGVDSGFFSPAPRPADGRCRILYAGRLVRQKGLDVLLQAFSEAARELPELELEIVGDGPLAGALADQARALEAAERVQFSGWREPEALLERYRAADLFALPSRDEGMPNVVLEAMACGLPVVATDVAGTRELVRAGENGILCPVGDAGALREALVALARRPELRGEFGRASRELAGARDWRAVAVGYLELAREAAGTPRRPVGAAREAVSTPMDSAARR